MNLKKACIFFILRYFRFFAKIQLKKINPLIIGITGSSGKTSTRDAIFSIIKSEFSVKVSLKANSETGIPLNILGLSPEKFSLLEWCKIIILCPVKVLTNWEKYDVYLVEMGIDSPNSPKNMSYLLTIIQPDIGILLNANTTHSQAFDHLVKTNNAKKRKEAITTLIAQEKGKIVTTLHKNKTAILNTDQNEIKLLQQNVQANILTFGKNKNCTVQICDYSFSSAGTTFVFCINKKEWSLQFKSQLLPQHFAYTFAAAIAVGITTNIAIEKIITNLQTNFKIPPSRSSLIEGKNNTLIIDSSYNSSTKPLLDMLELLNAMPGKRKLALLGDMRELGEISKIEHKKIAQKASQVCNAVFLVGPLMKKYAIPTIEKNKTFYQWFTSAYAASEYIQAFLKKGDLILIKGSQNTLLLEIAVENLMAHPEAANKLLARRGKFWNKKRSEILR